jgi:hypothetical protein
MTTEFESMTADVFYALALPLFDQIRLAMTHDNGTIPAIDAVNYALGAALQFVSDVFDQTEDPEIREQCQVTGGSLAALLRKNIQRLIHAREAEYELERAMAECVQTTIH